MRSQWFPNNSVALCADNFAHLSRFCSGPKALQDEVGFSPHLVFPIMITDYKIDVHQTPQISKKMVVLITLKREYRYVQNCKKISQEVAGRKSSLQND